MKKKNAEFVEETKSAVAKINEESNKSVRSWLVLGQIITEFVEKTKQNEPDAFKALADHPESNIGASSCRSYHAAYKLWTEVGQTSIPPDINYTSFVVIATTAGLNFGSRKFLLEQAKANNWSISDLKRQIKILRNTVKPEPPEPESEAGKSAKLLIDWNDKCKKVEIQVHRLTDLVSYLGNLNKDGTAPGIPPALNNKIRQLIQLMIVNHLVERDAIINEMPVEMAEAA